MYESVEFRIPEEYAHRFLARDEGKRLGDTVRVVEVRVDDPLYERIGRLNLMLLNQEGNDFFLGWHIRRHYIRQELDTAALLCLKITAVFEPAGEECGTLYDESTACSYCGGGRRQISELTLDLRRVPKSKDVARTIADEWIVSQRLAELLVDHGVTGLELRRVRHKARYQDDPIDPPMTLESGRAALQLAKEAGYPHPTGPFWIWFNRPEQAKLYETIQQEYITTKGGHKGERSSRSRPSYYQLIVTSKPVQTVSPTRFGIEPFDEDKEGQFRCPKGHVKGLNVLSELSIMAASWDGSDIVCTEDLIGDRRGLLVPAPMLLVSGRLFQLLRAEKIKGFEVELAHLI